MEQEQLRLKRLLTREADGMITRKRSCTEVVNSLVDLVDSVAIIESEVVHIVLESTLEIMLLDGWVVSDCFWSRLDREGR
jgi:hypothetical protein